ncbi:iron ABC transporter permease [Microbacterium sp. zg.Y625]|uniref:ABC transporter permease n=1 Tax=Microbacterium jiangjiandongii TaxID=3049071 RepID=UPI00214C23E2|nr:MULTISPECIES: iron ABC transporter permease [unclassified Microbacterium]MCR2793466.1 iron ABC transporter permease [Microbacterium sp. zg.Y625]MCR2815356.1 iron ABC transporter permease [Microbacterium sp. zg.Y843]WIM26973.1 iron ABC transporter permease [Microbacterium sp. zg-Y625]
MRTATPPAHRTSPASALPGSAPAPPIRRHVAADWARRHGLTTGLTLILLFLVLYPLLRLQVLALEDGARAYREAFALPELATTLLTTAALGLGSLVISLVLGTALAWFSLRLPRRHAWMSIIPILPIVLPAVAVVVGWAFLLSPQVGFINVALRALPFVDVVAPAVGLPSGPLNIYSVPGIVIVTGLQLTPLVFLFLQGSLKQLNFETIEAASVSGAGSVRAFFTVVLPLMRPALVYSAAFAMLLGLGQLTAPQFLGARDGIRVLATEVYRFGGTAPTDFALAAAVASPLLIAGILFILVQRLLLRRDFRFVSSGAKGASRPGRPSRWSAPFIALYGVITIVLPFGAIILVSLVPYWTSTITTFTIDNFTRALTTPAILDALVNSVGTSVGAILIALPLSYLLTDILYRRRGNAVARGIIDVLVQLPLGVPAVVFGVGLLFVYTGNPFTLYGTPALIVLTYVVIVLPFTVRMQLAARMGVGNSHEDAARASGAGLLRAHLTVVIPMMRGALAGAAVLAFVILTHEFAASMFVRSARTQVLGTLLYQEWTHGSYPMVAAVSIIMSVVTAVGLVVAVRLGGRNTLDSL